MTMVIFMKKNPKYNQISKSAFKARTLELFRKVEKSGQPLIITDHGKPTLEIRRYHGTAAPDVFETLRGSVLRFENPTDPVGNDDWQAFQ